MEQIKKLKSLHTKQQVVICYARNGHQLYRGPRQNIPQDLKKYYVYQKINNDKYSYIEIVEDINWFF